MNPHIQIAICDDEASELNYVRTIVGRSKAVIISISRPLQAQKHFYFIMPKIKRMIYCCLISR